MGNSQYLRPASYYTDGALAVPRPSAFALQFWQRRGGEGSSEAPVEGARYSQSQHGAWIAIAFVCPPCLRGADPNTSGEISNSMTIIIYCSRLGRAGILASRALLVA